MKLELNETHLRNLRDSLHECMSIADRYRHVLGDEDSIVLVQTLHEIGETLGLDVEIPRQDI